MLSSPRAPGFLPEAARASRDGSSALAGHDVEPRRSDPDLAGSPPIDSTPHDRRLRLVPDPFEHVCAEPRCDVVLFGRRPEPKFCSMRCRRRAEWARVVARDRARQAVQLAAQAAEIAAATDPERLAGEPFWAWRVRVALARNGTEAAELWQRAVEATSTANGQRSPSSSA